MDIYLYQRDFGTIPDGEGNPISTFELLLDQLKVPKEEWHEIETVILQVDDFDVE